MNPLLLSLLLSIAPPVTTAPDSVVVRRIADRILERYEQGYRSGKDGKEYTDPRDIPADQEIRLKTNYAAWHYTTGIINSALLQYAALSGDARYADYTVMHTAYSLQEYAKVRPSHTPTGDWHPFHGLRRFDELDFVGPECGALIDMESWYGNEDYEEIIQRAAEHIRHGQARLSDGTLVRTWPKKHTLWADDLNMGLSFMTRYATHYRDTLMLKDAILQVDNFNAHLWDGKRKLFWHAWYEETGHVAGYYWGRCNGWIMRATVELLDCLDPESEDFERILGYLRRQIDGIRPLQQKSGMWRNVLNKKSYEESSCTAIFTGAIAHAVRNGWIGPEYSGMALKGWEALKRSYIEDGQLNKVCVGTGIMDNAKGYTSRPARDGDTHGAGLILTAGMEILALKAYLSGSYCCDLRPTFNSCSLEMDAREPVPGLRIEYRKRGDIKWTGAQPLPFYKEQPGYRTSLMHLEEDTAYECRVVVNGELRSLSHFRTWKSDVPVARTIVLDPKKISFPVKINAKGSPRGWIRYTVPEGTVLENNGKTTTFLIEGASYVLLDDVVMKGPNIHDGAINVKNSEAVRIRNCEISGWGRIEDKMRFDKKGKPAVGEEVINFDGAIKIHNGSTKVVVERCYIHDPSGRTNSWRYSHPSGNEAVILYKPDHSTVLRYNDFIASDRHRFNDAVESFGNFHTDGGFNRDADINGNFMAFCNDDCIELDGGQRNVRCFDNRFEGALVGVSIQGCMQSPSFVYDNVFSGLGEEFGRKGRVLKVGSGAHGPEAKAWFLDNYIGPDCANIGFMETLELHVCSNIMDQSAGFADRETSPLSETVGNTMGLSLDEKDLPAEYPVRPCPFVLSRQRFTNPEQEFCVRLKALPSLKGSVPFRIRQNTDFDWFEVSPSSGVLREGEEIELHVRLLPAKMQDRRYWRGAFIVRTPDGLSRPCTIYKETSFIPPFKADRPGDTAVYVDAFHPAAGKPEIVEDPAAPDGKAVLFRKGADNTLEWEFSVPKTGRYYILLHGSGQTFSDIMASVDGSEFATSEQDTNTDFMTWTILAPGGDFNNRIAYYDFQAGKPIRLKIKSGERNNNKILSIDGIVVTDNPESFEPR
jgi:rhamnogalacturonyl hydrolase YesR